MAAGWTDRQSRQLDAEHVVAIVQTFTFTICWRLKRLSTFLWQRSSEWLFTERFSASADRKIRIDNPSTPTRFSGSTYRPRAVRYTAVMHDIISDGLFIRNLPYADIYKLMSLKVTFGCAHLSTTWKNTQYNEEMLYIGKSYSKSFTQFWRKKYPWQRHRIIAQEFCIPLLPDTQCILLLYCNLFNFLHFCFYFSVDFYCIMYTFHICK